MEPQLIVLVILAPFSKKCFHGRLISVQENVAWSPRSPDLSLYGFFLWRYFKAEVFKHRSRTFEELKKAIRKKIAGIPHDMLVRMIENF